MSDVDLDDPNWERREYDKFAAYGASKTANILHMVELDRRLRDGGVRAYAVHPGVVATSLARHMTREDFAKLSRYATMEREAAKEVIDVRHDFTTPDHGAATQVWAAVSPELAEVGSVYLADCRIREDVAAHAVDQTHALRLWELSEELCGARACITGARP
jgi:NAD(P)-dependent dehydrogenase (short-subunit alcohol dehydrogenase family)